MKHHLRTFYIITITQVLSIIGSAMTNVAIGIRVFNDTGDSTPLLLASFFYALPLMIGGSFAGVFADRWNRRLILILTDVGQAIGTGLLLFSFLSGNFQLWHLYAVSVVSGALGMLQRPAMEASVTMLVPDSQRDRANAIRQITGPAAGVVAPVITGFIYAITGVVGVMLIDLATFVVAVTVVALVEIPQPEADSAQAASVLADLRTGFQFLWKRRILFILMLYAAFINFLLFGPMTLSTPYIITLTGSEKTLGILLGLLNAGIVTGGVVMMIWGGTRPRIHGIMLGLLFRGAWLAVYGLVRTPPMLGLALFFIFFSSALVDASFMSILQLKVPPHMQGRIFALLFQLMYIANPLSLLLTGPLVDNVLEPAVGSHGWQVVAPLVGSQPGSGMGLLMLVAGLLILISTALVYAWPKTRRVERDLPDHSAVETAAVLEK
ncbi:MAG: MFS transporter [Anaerolineales bacterium]|nr:MFS transporter [Anaerolineales bacterium]